MNQERRHAGRAVRKLRRERGWSVTGQPQQVLFVIDTTDWVALEQRVRADVRSQMLGERPPDG